MESGVDKGFCLNNWKLSCRRKFIRNLWTGPLIMLFVAMLHYFSRGLIVPSHISIFLYAFIAILFLSIIIQMVYTFLMWKSDKDLLSYKSKKHCRENRFRL